MKGPRPGLTLVELLAGLAILALLASLTLVGIQASREAGRRTSCANNLRQIGLATANYEVVHRMLPPGEAAGQGFLVPLLPFLERQSLYETLLANQMNGVAYTSEAVETYLCPSDGAPRGVGTSNLATANYAGNCGVWAKSHGFNGTFRYLHPILGFRSGPIRLNDFPDGLAQTAAVSEIWRASGGWHRPRVNWNTPQTYGGTELEAFVKLCAGLPTDPHGQGWQGDPWSRGMPWTAGGVGFTLYNHAAPPNSPSCFNGGEVLTAISAAGSAHRSGVNLLYADGHLTLVASSLDLDVWRELGSRVKTD